MSESMIGWQCLYMISMYSGTFLSYLIPVLLINRQKHSSVALVANNAIHSRKTQRILSVCNCLSAGIFLGICFLNLIPYVDQEFNALFTATHFVTNFPIGMFSVILGLFLVLTLETLVIKCRSNASAVPVLHLDDEELTNDSLNEEQRQELLDVRNSDKESNELSLNNNSLNSESHHMHSHSHNIQIDSSSSTLSFFILMFATSVHSVFEGLALGLQTDPTKAMHLFIGIILHECLVGFALGLNCARIDCSLKTNIKFSIVFSLTIPIGIVMGVVLGYTPGLLGRSISAVFQGLAAGTFIHVTFHELIPSEFLSTDSDSNGSQKLFKIFLLFIGFNLMALMTLFTDSHE